MIFGMLLGFVFIMALLEAPFISTLGLMFSILSFDIPYIFEKVMMNIFLGGQFYVG
ncbi:hypothetical protein [Heyndrickxia oleronia]|uniref:hypothetical protein n=1 Tax=Heyndrickxia oleronia TaxID=38875 RepID=UPI0037533ADE